MKLFAVVILSVFVSACGSSGSKDTLYPYEYSPPSKPIKTVMIAPMNYSKPSRYYLRDKEEGVDEVIKTYLTDNDVRVVSNRPFKSLWKKMPSKYGILYDETTGKRTRHFDTALKETLTDMFNDQPTLDAIVFTDLVVQQVRYTGKNGRIASWDGVSRKVKVQGIGEGITDAFNWQQPVDAVSLEVRIIGRDGKMILHNRGGIQISQALEIQNGGGTFKRRRDLLTNKGEIEQAAEIAFYPAISSNR